MPSSNSHRRTKLAAAILLCVVGSGLAGLAVYGYVRQEGWIRYFSSEQIAQRRMQQDRERQKQQIRSVVEHTASLLRTLGAACDEVPKKGDGILDEIDLSRWHGTDRDLPLLKVFLLLEDDNRDHGHNNYFMLTLGPATTDASLAYLKDLTNLEALHIQNAPVTDAGLAHLDRLTRLHEVDLAGTRVTDACLERFARFPDLWRLDVSGTPVTLPAVARFSQRHPDVSVRFAAGSVKGGALDLDTYFDDYGQLRKNDTSASRDQALSVLAAHRSFQSIRLSQSNITDAGLKALENQADLEDLNLSKTSITDAGLEHLKHLRQLRNLDLSHTKVTAAGIKNLAQALPACKIVASLPPTR